MATASPPRALAASSATPGAGACGRIPLARRGSRVTRYLFPSNGGRDSTTTLLPRTRSRGILFRLLFRHLGFPVARVDNIRHLPFPEKLPKKSLQQATMSAYRRNRRSKLSFDDEKILILEVQNRPVLWDYTLQLKDRSAKIRNQAWEEITKIFNGKYNMEELKYRFKSLHDTYRKIILYEYNGLTRKNSEKKWSHYGSMQFLRDFCLRNDTVFNSKTVVNKIPLNTSNLINDQDEDNVQSIQTDSTEQRNKRKNTETNAIERIDVSCKQSNNFAPTSVPDEIDAFLLTLGHRLRRMPFRVQLDMMQKILDDTYKALINEIE